MPGDKAGQLSWEHDDVSESDVPTLLRIGGIVSRPLRCIS